MPEFRNDPWRTRLYTTTVSTKPERTTDMTYSAGSMTPHTNADTLGTMIKVALIESASYLTALQEINEAVHAGDLDRAKNVLATLFTPDSQSLGNYNTLTNLQAALYNALPRGGEPVSGY